MERKQSFRKMKLVIVEVLYHKTKFKETESYHLYCPR